MRYRFLMFLLLLSSVCLHADEVFVVNSVSRTLSRIDINLGTVNNSFAQLAQTPNHLIVDNDEIYVVCSGANSVQVISRNSGALIRTLFIAPSANCWDVLKDNNYLYVTGLFTDKVYKVSLQSNTVVAELNVGVSPEGMAVLNNKLYVCNTGGYASGYASSSVSVIDLSSFSVIATIPVWKNPQDIQVYANELHVLCTGNWSNVAGSIDIIDSSLDVRTDRIDLGGNPWSLWISPSGIGYAGDGNDTSLFSYDAATKTILHGTANPLSPGAIVVHGAGTQLALLSANWSGNGIVYLRDANWQPLGQYTVGLTPTDLWYYQFGSANTDEVLPVAQMSISPNPLRRDGLLTIKSDMPMNGYIELYNLKGQKLFHKDISSQETSIPVKDMNLRAGLYFYKTSSGSKGKLVVY
ncbi:MAG: T9SS type A sorting domain-containing protein [Candidatus Cloacimonetes bacterium]|nr:T9SS type A sorting domain-containing protein [Candidatus Cloacimonadota bacterium]